MSDSSTISDDLVDHVPDPGDSDEQQLVRYLSEHSDECPLCNYNLRGVTRAICPECGHGLKLTVGLTDLLIWPWAAMAVALCLLAGLGLMCLFMVILEGMPPDNGAPWSVLVRDLTIYVFMASVPIAAAVVFLRKRILRMPTSKQKTLAWSCIGICIVNFTLFFVSMAIAMRT